MQESFFSIGNIPAVLYGEEADQVFLFVHGKCGYKEEGEAFGEIVCPRGWQVLAADLPEHGSRKGEKESFDPWHVVPELKSLLAYARARWSRVALRANSIGAWFSMLAFQEEPLEQCLFVSPVLNMPGLIGRMMQWAGVTEEELEARETIETSFGETLSWRYFQYAQSHPVQTWPHPTAILYAGRDELTPRQEAEDFAGQFRCDLAVMEEGEHWFHTSAQLAELDRWTRTNTAPALSPEELLFFAGAPEELALYEGFRCRLLETVGEVGIRVSKTQITCSGRYGFAFVSHPRRKKDRGILVSFGLSHRQESPRIQAASEPYPNRWTHHVLVQSPEEIDQELMDWVQEAFWFANAKKRGKHI